MNRSPLSLLPRSLAGTPSMAYCAPSRGTVKPALLSRNSSFLIFPGCSENGVGTLFPELDKVLERIFETTAVRFPLGERSRQHLFRNFHEPRTILFSPRATGQCPYISVSWFTSANAPTRPLNFFDRSRHRKAAARTITWCRSVGYRVRLALASSFPNSLASG
jgi:hypothetical protein